MLPRGILLSVLALSAACRRSQESPSSVPTPLPNAQAPGPVAGSAVGDPLRRPALLDRQAPLSQCASRSNPLSAARNFYNKGKYEEALACAAEATALMPEQPQAHSERAAALAALGRLDDAQLAYALALGLNPNDVDSLLGAAHLYAVTLPSNRERDELARVYTERGLSLPEVRANRKLRAQFALLSAMALNDLGQAKEALDRADYVLSSEPESAEARYERAVALFELCRFTEANAAFTTLLKDPDRGAHAHHHLGLLLERENKWKQAEEHFAKARKLAPSEFWEPQLLPKEVFEAEVGKALAGLPQDMQRDLSGIPVTAEELPTSNDLISGDPPLSPAILGLFRGPPLGEACTPAGNPPCRSVALYRRNLARVAKTREELLNQIRVTLLHEVGHLRGEDDLELAARGLE
jgi:tetratricopeptide (TPR) repeat protein